MNVSNSTLPNGWTRKPLCELAHVKTGSRNNQDKDARGRYPFFVRSSQVERIDYFSYNDEAILIPGEGGIGSIFHYINGPHEVHQRVYRISDFSDDIDPRYLYSYIARFFGAHAMQNTVKATVDSLRLPTFLEFVVDLPPVEEQRAIAAALTDAAAWVESLEALIAKKRDVFEGMRQMLLTGTQRLPGFHENWGELRLCDIGSFGGGCGFPTRMQGGSSGIPFYKVSDMNTGGNETIMRVARNYVTEQEAKALGANVYLPGSVIFAKVGAAIFLERKRILSEPSCIDNNMMALTPNAKLMDTSYLHLLLSLVKLSAHSASTALPALNAGVLAAITIRVPSLDEQHAIAAILLDASTEIDNLVAERDKAELIRQGMAQDLLTGKVRLV